MKLATIAAVVLLSSVAGNRTAVQAPSGPAQSLVAASSMAGVECVQCPLIWNWIIRRITGG